MEQFELILSYITTIFIVIIGVITYILKLVNKTIELKKIKNKELVTKEMLGLIEEAEEIFDIGVEKKKFVLTRLKNFGVENNIKINLEEFEKELSKLIDFTKQVNYMDREE